MELPLTGGCMCGAIRYQITQAPIEVYACHCTDCQRITSSAFSIGVIVPEAGFKASGKEAIQVPGGVTAGGRIKTRAACPDCGTWLFGKPHPGTRHPGMIRVVRGGTLDDTSWLVPTSHFWTRSRQPWVVLPETGTIYQTQPNHG